MLPAGARLLSWRGVLVLAAGLGLAARCHGGSLISCRLHAKLREELVHALWTDSVGEINPDMLVEILLYRLPVLLVIANLPALHAHRDDVLECRYFSDVLKNQQCRSLFAVWHRTCGDEDLQI